MNYKRNQSYIGWFFYLRAKLIDTLHLIQNRGFSI